MRRREGDTGCIHPRFRLPCRKRHEGQGSITTTQFNTRPTLSQKRFTSFRKPGLFLMAGASNNAEIFLGQGWKHNSGDGCILQQSLAADESSDDCPRKLARYNEASSRDAMRSLSTTIAPFRVNMIKKAVATTCFERFDTSGLYFLSTCCRERSYRALGRMI